ncbi:response regulator transcription factor [Paeniglutamicibacter sp. ZC-3]|uniref:response regulator n=1 Tax=Paeniglutamicibacter sp. ZC-3 TaxID=2986919 RepID=UPI0021F7CB42|nr:response regulator transcription factor [Paeniglutamicibacter sp. ZC-3]MCV9993013.1 response regulator transcription factor [Paeniglutamicibacter sp. ZC-3]
MIGILVVDDQSLIRAGFSALLGAEDDMQVLGQASNGVQALAQARALGPDIVLMDIRMPLGDGITAAAAIASDPSLAHTRIIMLTTFELDDYILDSIRAGASGFLVKDTEPEELIAAVRIVAAGDSLLSPSVTRKLLAQVAATKPVPTSRQPAAVFDVLTEREREVLMLIGTGKSNSEIAEELFITPLTAKTHVSRIIGKMGVRDRTGLVVIAYESGLITPGAQPAPQTSRRNPD